MIDTLSLVIGAIVGLVAGGAIVFLAPYRSLRSALTQLRGEFSEEQAKNNELQNTLANQQSVTYQTRQAMLAQQKKFEDDQAGFGEQRSRLEQQLLELKGRSDREQKNHLQEVERLRDALSRTEQEKTSLQKQFAQERVEWDRQLQSVSLQNKQMEGHLQMLQRDKATLDSRFEEQQEAWERERLEFQIQINTLEDSLTLYKARANQNLLPDSLHMMEQFREEATVELNQRQAAWERERQALQEQLKQLADESQPLQTAESDARLFSPGSWGQEKRNLLQQLEQAQQSQRDMQDKMAARDRQAEQERSALEAEIEQLMERFLRLYNEQNG